MPLSAMKVGGAFIAIAACMAVCGAASPAAGQQRWLGPNETGLATDGQVHFFPLPHERSGPTTVTVAADGRLWFTEGSGNRIGSMNPDGSGLTEFSLPHPDSSPRIIARGADGNLWFSEHTGNRMARITQDGDITEWDIPSPDSQPRAISLGADGNIWFGMFAAGKVGRITPKGIITEFAPPTPDSGPRALATGADGNVWFSEYKGNKIGRITPKGAIVEFPLPRPNSGPGDITMGPDGALWFVELSGGIDGVRTDGNRVGRITYRWQDQRISPAGSGGLAHQHCGRPRSQCVVHTWQPPSGASRPKGRSPNSPPVRRPARWDCPPAATANRPRAWSIDCGLPTAAPIASAICSSLPPLRINHRGPSCDIKMTTAAIALCLCVAANAQAPGASASAAAGAAIGPAPTTFVVKFKIKPGKNAEFEKVMARLQSALPKSEPGNLYYDLYLPSADSQTYVLIEHYKNADAVQAHGKDPNTQQMASAIKDLLDGPPSADRLILVSSKP